MRPCLQLQVYYISVFGNSQAIISDFGNTVILHKNSPVLLGGAHRERCAIKMNVDLTKESRRVLKSIYDIYRERRENGQPKSSAARFEEGTNIDGLSDAKRELSKAGLIQVDIAGGFDLDDKAIIFMENFKKDTILKWLEVGANFIP